MPFSTISMKIHCQDFLPLYPAFPPSFSSLDSRTSVSFYKGNIHTASNSHISQHNLMDYMCFKIPDGSLDMINCIGILRWFAHDSNSIQKGFSSLEAVLLSIPEGYRCVDLSLYKDAQVVLLLNEASSPAESPGRSWMMMIQTSDLSFASVSRPAFANLWRLDQLKDLAIVLHLDDGKVRSISHSVSKPLAISASRGVACVFSSRRHALVYILDEDEEEASDPE